MAKQVHLVHGNDEYQVTARAKAIVTEFLPQGDAALGLERISGVAETIEPALAAIAAVMEALETRSFLGDGKLVWLEDCRFLADSGAGKTAAVKERLEPLTRLLQSGLIPGHVLLVTSPHVDKRYAFYKACLAVGTVQEFAIPEQSRDAEKSSRDWLRGWLQSAELRMSEGVQQLFIERVGYETRQLVNETEKLAVYLGARREATAADIAAITSASRESAAWDLADAFGKRDLGRALVLLRQLLYQQEAPMALMAVIGGRIRDLLVYREALDRGWLRAGGRGWIAWGELPAEAARLYEQHLGRDPRKVHPFRANLLAEQAREFTARELYACLERHAATQEALVSSTRDAEQALEFMLIRMLRRPLRRARTASGV